MTTQALKALEPFAKEAKHWHPTWPDETKVSVHQQGAGCNMCGKDPGCETHGLTVGDLRRAREAYTGGSGDGVRALSDADIHAIATAVAEEYADCPGFDEGKKIWECHDQYIVREQYVRRRAEELEYEFKRALSAFRAHGYSLALPAMEGWKPIETAPQNGTRIEVSGGTFTWSGNYGKPRPCNEIAICHKIEGDTCWSNVWNEDMEHWPTHWRPVASPPSPDNERDSTEKKRTE